MKDSTHLGALKRTRKVKRKSRVWAGMVEGDSSLWGVEHVECLQYVRMKSSRHLGIPSGT